ncbi:MAG: protein-L-isoaspartate O-methyltransferase [Rhizobiales bacterium]|nr:protein-L-isoaspartate O-methyltransferase [Hyphomicrobiales bacterium]
MSDYSTARLKMVDGQVRPSDVTDIRILDAMLAVPREEFVPASLRAMAYLDLDLDVAGGKTKRCLLKPYVLAKMLQAAEISETDTVLVVGCASGYSAAVIAKLAARVVATEPDADLAAAAKANLAKAGAANATVTKTDPAAGDAAHGPYDVIVLEGSTEVVPEGLYSQLKMGGRLAGVFAIASPSKAWLVTRSPGDFGNRVLFDASAPVLPGLERVPAFSF